VAIFALVGAIVLALCGTLVAGSPAAFRHPSGAFDWERFAKAPAAWLRISTPSGDAVLSSPPSFAPIKGDPGSVSTAVVGGTGNVVAYLNVTPQQGGERRHGFGAFRASLLRHDHDYAVHVDAVAEGLAFNGGVGSCVIDDYLTRVGNNPYREIACLVVGRHGGTVVVATAAGASWSLYRQTLREAVASITVS
jgi:hypothetical protein